MEHQSLLMKVMRDFAMADPENCEREWDAYLALLNRKETVSVSFSTRSTSPLHHLAPAAAVTAPATTRSTGPLRASSDAVSTTTTAATASTSTSARNLKSATSSVASASSDIITKDDLSPGAWRLYDYLVGASTELDPIHDAGDIGAADLAVSAPTTCSSKCPSNDAYASVSMIISSATPNSPTTTCGIVPELATSAVSDKALDVDVAGNTSPTAACLLADLDDCTGNEDSVYMSLTPSISTVVSEACSVNPVLAPGASAFSLMPAAYLVDNVDVTKLNEIRLPPWQGIRCKGMIQVLLMHDFILESTQLMLWTTRNPWPPPFPNMSAGIQNILQLECQVIPFMRRTILFHLHVESVERARNKIGRELCCFSSLSAELLVLCFASYRILYLHGPMDIMQISGDWYFLRAVEFEWDATLTVTILALGVQCVQLHRTVVFKWTDQFCHDILFVSCQFARVHFLLFNRGYHALNIAHLSATYLCSRLVRMVGRYPWAGPAREPDKEGATEQYIPGRHQGEGLAGNWTETAASAEAWLDTRSVCSVRVSPSSSLDSHPFHHGFSKI